MIADRDALERLLGRAAIAALRRPIGEARGLPGAAYTSAEFFALERQRMFRRVWICVGYASDIPDPGDAAPIEAAGLPLILVRDRGGKVRVFHNVCRHRAALVLTEKTAGLAQLSCPYHAWAYELDGRFKAAPFFDGTKDGSRCKLDGERLGLVEARSAVWGHWVFVNLDGRAPPFAEYAKPLFDLVGGADIAATRPGHREDWSWNANWKFQNDNWETYHHVWVHRDVFTKLSDDLDLETGLPKHEPRPCGTVVTLRRRPGTDVFKEAGHDLPFVPLPQGEERVRATSLLFPNFTLTVHADHLASVVAMPMAADRTVSMMGYFFVGEAATDPRYAAGRKRVLDRWLGPSRQQVDAGGIRSQDMVLWENQQRARASPVADEVLFSPVWEPNIHHFQNMLVEVMARPD